MHVFGSDYVGIDPKSIIDNFSKGLGMASILAVDDSVSMRHMVSITLKSAGHSVTEAVDGKIALDKAKKSSFDLVLTDVTMPNMDGIALISELRKLPSYKNTPLLMLTTESSSEKKLAGRNAGATGWIVKPFDPEQLLAEINKALENQQQAMAASK